MKVGSDLKISVSGVRAIVGKSLTPKLIIGFAEAFATWTGGGKIAVAYDTRPSREFVKNGVFAGLLSAGATPIDAGILPIPSFQIFVNNIGAQGGIAITASHNPVKWNALKLIKKGGYYLYSFEAEELFDIYNQERVKRTAFNNNSVKNYPNSFKFHLEKLLKFADTELIKKRKPKVVIDSCNGAGSPFVRDFLEKLGCEVITVNTDVNQIFPRNPEPVPENLTKLSEEVKKHNADIGFAQDADADRLAVVDENGTPIGEETTLSLAIQYYLRRKGKTDIVVNLSTTRMIEDIARQENVNLFRSKVGEINVVEQMIKKGSMIGGEGNGGIITGDIHYCRDSFTGMVLFLEYFAWSNKKVSELKKELKKYFMKKAKIALSYMEYTKIFEFLKEEYIDNIEDLTDGIKVSFSDYWFHVRSSNTEPIVRIIVESDSEIKSDEILNMIVDKIKRWRGYAE